jgi:hypothetical protein
MQAPYPETTTIPCLGCSRPVVVPSGGVRMAMRKQKNYFTFCSRRCNLEYVAKEGTRQQEEQLNAKRHPVDPSSDWEL